MFDTNAPRRSFRLVRSDHPVYRLMSRFFRPRSVACRGFEA